MSIEEKRREYLRLAHAMQSGVAYVISLNLTEDHTPKHLRVGVNSAMVEHSAILHLLMDKGIVTEDEYYDALIKAMGEEVALYEKQLTEHLGQKTVLG